MNIAIIAPTKFDFQDLACVELGLRWPTKGAPSLRAEPEKGEDAEITWEEKGKRRLCEVQIKGRSTGALDMATLAEYLAHFPDRQADGCLLERLIGNPDQVVLFVASERCQDEVSEFLVPTSWAGERRASAPNRRAGENLAAALRYLSEWPKRTRTKIPTRLEADRAAKVSELAKHSVDQLAIALNQVFIHEQETPASIAVRLHQRLFNHGVPTDRLSDGISRLKRVIAEDRAGRPDVFDLLREVLADFAPEQLSQPKYLPRGDEDRFSAELAKQRAILLSGPPRVGKSWLAQQLAGGLQLQGFEVARSSHIDQADRFLNDPIRRPRAYVLEDPLGVRQSHANATIMVSELRRLLSSLPTDRRLIVAQSDGPVLQVFRQNNLKDCAIGRFEWRALGPLTIEQAEALWRRDASDAAVASDEIERVSTILRKRSDLRDAGALAYLATTFDTLRDGATENEIVAQARGDAVDFAQALADESAEVGNVLRGVAVSTEATTGISETDLAFVLNGREDRPSLDQSGSILVYGQQDATEAPAYAEGPLLAPASKEAIITLRRRRVLENRSNHLSFIHPYLRAGAQAIFRPDLEEDVAAAVALSERAFAAVDPKVSLAAARNLDWIASALTAREGGLLRAISLAKIGLRSLYPATRDACFAFLASRANDLPPEQLKQLRNWVSAVDIDLDQIKEVGGVLVISKTSIFLRYKRIALESVKPYLDAIETDEPVDLDPALAYAILLVLWQNDVDLTPKLMDRFLSMDAAVLRSAAIEKWLKHDRNGDEDIMRRIGNDAAPIVSNAVLDALVGSWEYLSETRKEVLLSLLAVHARAPGSAIYLMERLSKFNRVEEFGETPPWQVFSKVAPIAFEHAPDVVFRNGRIVSVIEDAIRVGEGKRLIPLLTIWAKHLAHRIVTRLPDEFELSVPDSMIDVGSPSWRWPLINNILKVGSTGARLRIVATLVSRWNDLSSEEQLAIGQLIAQDETDTNWLRAAALTRQNVPADVVSTLSELGDLLNLAPPDLLAELGEPLYRACLHVYVGTPQPLWWLGTHHVRETAWAEAARWSAGGSDRPCFQHALDDQISFVEDDVWLAGLVNQFEVGELPAVFAVFLRRKIGDNGNWRTPAWNCLLDRGVEAGLIDDWIEQISNAAPVFLDDLRDVRLWLGKGTHEDRLIECLEDDIHAYRTVDLVAGIVGTLGEVNVAEVEAFTKRKYGKGQSSEELVSAVLNFLQQTLKQNPPRLFGTWDYIARNLKELDTVPQAILDWVARKRLQVLDDRSKAQNLDSLDVDQSVLASWTGPR